MRRLILLLLLILFVIPWPAWGASIPFQTDKTGFTEGSGGVQVLGGCVNDTRGGAIAEDNVGCLRITGQGDLHVAPFDSGGVSATDATAHAVKTLSVDTTGTPVVPSTIVTDAATIARGQSNVLLGDVAMFGDNGTNYERIGSASGRLNTNASQNGTWTMQPGNTANTTPWLVSEIPTTSGGTTPCYLTSAATTNATNCKASAGQLYGFDFVNTTTTIYYLRLYNLAAAPTCSSATGFVRTIPVPPAIAAGGAGGITRDIAKGESYGTGLGFCLTGGGSSIDNTNAATGVYVTLQYK